MKNSIHCYISGKVQGVFFRASTHEYAKKLGLTGWVKNLSDGRVEVYASGDEEYVGELYGWLKCGPVGANVENVELIEAVDESCVDFEIR